MFVVIKVKATRILSESATSRFCSHWSIFGVIWLVNYAVTILNRWDPFGDRNFYCSAHVLHTTAQSVISRRWLDKSGYGMSKNEKCTCKACETKFSALLNLWHANRYRRHDCLNSSTLLVSQEAIYRDVMQRPSFFLEKKKRTRSGGFLWLSGTRLH